MLTGSALSIRRLNRFVAIEMRSALTCTVKSGTRGEDSWIIDSLVHLLGISTAFYSHESIFTSVPYVSFIAFSVYPIPATTT